MGGLASRRKGASGEREICKILREHGYEAKRGWQSRGGGKEEPDVVTTLPGFHLEIKRTERTNIWAAMRQAESDCAEGTMPLVVTRKSREPWLCVLHFDDFLDIIAKAEESGIIIGTEDSRACRQHPGSGEPRVSEATNES